MRGEEVAAALLPAACLPPVAVDGEELQDARWFPAAWLRAALSGAAWSPQRAAAVVLHAAATAVQSRLGWRSVLSLMTHVLSLASDSMGRHLPDRRLTRALLEVAPRARSAHA